jgi:mRNA-degrading endonuclease RelE of RelBE toxin-antitoxin system
MILRGVGSCGAPRRTLARGAFIRGNYRRLKVGAYRVMYVAEDDIITIERVDLVL